MGVNAAIDITTEDRKTILALLQRHLPGTAAWVYGSRVKWTSRPQSDLDLVVFATPEQWRQVGDLREAFEESNLPFRVDLFVWDDVPESFRNQITTDHVVLAKRREISAGAGDTSRTDGRESKTPQVACETEPATRGAYTWPIMSLSEAGVSLLDCEHRTPPSSERGYPYVGIPQVKDGRIELTDVRHITQEHFLDWTRKAKPQPFDVVLSRRCNPGDTGFVPPGLHFALGQNLVLLRSDGERVLKPFLRWLVRSPQWWTQVRKYINVGAVFDSLKCADIPEFRLAIAPLSDQRAIARILGTLDDKTDLNRQMNATLEAMARALFKSWFVDFDPVRAKMEGRDTGLPKDIADLFPDRLLDSELGEIPDGWTVAALGDMLELAYGRALKAENRRHDGTVPVYGSRERIGWHDASLVQGPGIVVGRKGNPGIVTWVPVDFFPIDTTFYVVPKNGSRALYFLLYALQGQNLPAVGADSAVPGLNRNLAYMNQQIAATEEVVDQFGIYVSHIFARRDGLNAESMVLASLRDTLLPKLVSGELPVTDADHLRARH